MTASPAATATSVEPPQSGGGGRVERAEKLLAAAVGAVPSGVDRPGQRVMAGAVMEAIDSGEHLLVQAGTGTGKSLAYLVPALLQRGSPVVVSTATLALQSQLVEVDLPRLADAVEPLLGRRPSYAVLKGRHHYACLARLDPAAEEQQEPDLFGGGDGGGQWLGHASKVGKQVVRLREWAQQTETGDRDELDPGVDDSVWRTVSMPARECVGAQRCPFGEDCFAEASRVRARAADIVVTNHSLLAVDMLAGRHILPPHEVLIVDEAHELADRVTSAAQAELTPDGLDRATRRLRAHVDADVTDRLTEAADALALALANPANTPPTGTTAAAPSAAGRTGGAGAGQTGGDVAFPGGGGGWLGQSSRRPGPSGRLVALPAEVRDAVSLVQAATRRAAQAIGTIGADDPDAVRKQQAKTTAVTLAEVAERLLDCSERDVIWIESGESGGSGGAGGAGGRPGGGGAGGRSGGFGRPGLHVAPLSVAGLLGTLLFAERTVIATSATLALGGRFDTVATGLGLPLRYGRTPATNDIRPEEPETSTGGTDSHTDQTGAGNGRADGGRAGRSSWPTRSTQPHLMGGGEGDGEAAPPLWRALDVGSPFDYARQGILYVAARLPRPTQSGLSEAAGEELVRLVESAGGRTLGLFSSRRAAERAAEVVRSRTKLPIYLQGDEALPILVRKFRAEPESCLFGVMSLWQGVDVPGEACQLVVIDRLPFPRPDEPLAAARAAAVDAAGGSGFAAVSVPIAAVRLAQGAGRLVRAAGDRGVVAVLDPRLHTARGYGPYLRDSLPPFWYTTKPDVVHAALRRLAATATAGT